MHTIPELIDVLSRNRRVLGLIEFGSDHRSDNFTTGDYDLLAILETLDYQIKSIHFYIGNTPVDLNLRTMDYLRQPESVSGFEREFFGGRIIYDATGEVTRLFQRLQEYSSQTHNRPLTEDDIARIRHWHRHILDKTQGRMDSMPAFCSFLLNTNIFWLIENYFRIRNLKYKGLKAAFEYLEEREPEIYERIQRFYTMFDLPQKAQLTQELTELILRPIQGMWKRGELLAFGDEKSRHLQEQGQSVFKSLFTG